MLCVFLAAAGLAAFPAAAQSTDELARVREEAARLRQQLDALDERIHVLEGEHGTPQPPAAPSEKQAFFTLQRNWSEIQPGTPKARVDALLGKPERILRINGDLVWYYIYPGLGRGSVFFNSEDKVSATQAPRTGWAR